MKVLFLCSSMEPGRDGVGDYTRRLGCELIRQGHDCRIIALNDRHYKSPEAIEERQEDEGTSISVLRFGAQLPWNSRAEHARAWVDSFSPDWISLQYVSYGFHSKGLPLWWNRKFPQLLPDGVKLHVMFHELWIGADTSALFKNRMIGQLQHYCLRNLLRAAQPSMVSTSNTTYAAMLRDGCSVDAHILPLFGNLPVAGGQDFDCNLIGELRICRPDESRDSIWIGIIFGSIQKEWDPQTLLTTLFKECSNVGKRLVIISVGRLGAAGEFLWRRMSEEFSDAAQYVKLGEQPAKRISSLLQLSDFGIATSPMQLIGKSGSAAAMIDHGLPVIVSRDNWEWRGGRLPHESEPLIHLMNEALPQKLIHSLGKQPPKPRVASVAAQMIKVLKLGGQ
jgi:hypothetical protein